MSRHVDDRAERTCPGCGKDRLVSWREAVDVFDVSRWRAPGVDEPGATDLVCSFCHVAEDTDGWRRLKSVNKRAAELAGASGSKWPADYEIILTQGDGDV